MTEITIRQPDDFHVHLRTGDMLSRVIAYSNVFGKVLAMGNLTPPITTIEDVQRYRMEILRHNPDFTPIMSIMLVNKTTPKMLLDAHIAGVKVLKLIPGGTSTGSDDGVSLENLKKFYPVLRMAENLGFVLSVHWELLKNEKTGEDMPEKEREEKALNTFLRIIINFPCLKIVAEHISTANMVTFVEFAPDNIAGTITAHHVGPYTLDDVMEDDKIINPYFYCKPILKRAADIEAVTRAMLSGKRKFFFGSDSAPHPTEKKISQPYAAGIFSPGIVSLPHIWDIFNSNGKSAEEFENFVSKFGSQFYCLPENEGEITLTKEEWTVPSNYSGIVPYLAGQTMNWKIKA